MAEFGTSRFGSSPFGDTLVARRPPSSAGTPVRQAAASVYIRDQFYSRVAQLEDILTFEATERHLGLGTWVLTAPFGPAAIDALLATPGSGIDVRDDVGRTIFSGPMRSWRREVSQGSDVLTVNGWDDMAALHNRFVLPEPLTSDPALWTVAHDSATGAAADVVAHFINRNVGQAALTSRREPELTVITVTGGPNIATAVTGRFQNLLEHVAAIAGPNGISVTVRQKDGAIFCQVRPGRDMSNVEISPRAGTLQGWTMEASAPSVTAVYGAGTGELAARYVRTEFRVPPTTWPGRVESFVDYSNGTNAEVNRKIVDTLNEGVATTSLTIVPSEALAAQYGTRFDMGDKVTVVLDGVRSTQTVTVATLRISDGVVSRSFNVGPDKPKGPAALFNQFRRLGSRVRTLEGS